MKCWNHNQLYLAKFVCDERDCMTRLVLNKKQDREYFAHSIYNDVQKQGCSRSCSVHPGRAVHSYIYIYVLSNYINDLIVFVFKNKATKNEKRKKRVINSSAPAITTRTMTIINSLHFSFKKKQTDKKNLFFSDF